jgi:hypothetical protein
MAILGLYADDQGQGRGSGAWGTRWAAHQRLGGSEAGGRQKKVLVGEVLRWERVPMLEMRQGGRCGVR